MNTDFLTQLQSYTVLTD